MKNKIKFTLIPFVVAGTILLSSECNKQPKNLEEKADSGISVQNIFQNEPNYPIMSMGKFKLTYEEPNFIDPNKLQEYKVPYEPASKLIGEIITGKFGFFKNNKIVTVGNPVARNIEEVNDVFNPAFKDYQWLLSIKKPKDMKEVDFTKAEKYSRGFKIKQKRMDANSISDIYAFPIKDYGDWYEALSHKIIFVYNKDIDGLYKKPGTDINDPNKLLDSLYFIQGVKEGSWFTILTKK